VLTPDTRNLKPITFNLLNELNDPNQPSEELRNKPVDISEIRHLYPFEAHYMNINGHKLHYVDEGRGDPVVMVHGNPTWSFYFRELIKALSRQYRIIAPDHIGCGLSEKPAADAYGFGLKNRIDDLDELLDQLSVRGNITLILHDWGGMIGMGYAVRHPARIRRLVVMNTFAFLPPADYRVPWVAYFIRQAGPLASLAVLGLNLFSTAALHLNSRQGLARDVKNGLTAPYNCWNHRIAVLRFVQDIPLSRQDPSYPLAESVDDKLALFSDVPILVCWGEHDFVFNHQFLKEWQNRFPQAEVHRFSDAGHNVLEDVPQKIVPLVENFLQRHPL
jgi:pimeloyl-ACP methyl ester carboxylesterase